MSVSDYCVLYYWLYIVKCVLGVWLVDRRSIVFYEDELSRYFIR